MFSLLKYAISIRKFLLLTVITSVSIGCIYSPSKLKYLCIISLNAIKPYLVEISI